LLCIHHFTRCNCHFMRCNCHFMRCICRALTIKFKNSLDLPKKFSKFPQISVKFPRQT
jgi:hypothetical protein